MQFKDYYKVLGVKADADIKDIKAAYRKLARKYHPDMNAESGAEEKFKEVVEAYEVLKDTERRAEFDELRMYGQRSGDHFEPPPGWQQARGSRRAGEAQFGSDFSEFFNSMFGGGRQDFDFGGARQQHNRGRDIEIEMPVFLEDTLRDNLKNVEYQMTEFDGRQMKPVKKHLRVTIPKGVTEGERIRVKGQGEPAVGAGSPGDLYLHIRLVPHPLFDVQGHNLVITLPVAPWEAALGSKVTVPTLEGSIKLTVKPDSQSGHKLRVKGKGLKIKGTDRTGDLYAVIKIVMPPAANEKGRQLWQQLSETASFDPRAEWSSKT
ncbi:DnaJ domain-containing protein [Aestuariicella hydrocarbonica]|uniref:DnaJ domain-containing protein n=1 Tax=Pseudomaricurvus hydrocarbonicus TaxID=1470433 RepID=A0A9E5T1I7_9GAMM|nr:DnaJ C-terminal domain-containing protein [Aestuariicella hydrocarbonica]NHO67485.1 DnaJ domain-containing protein [Aestuariicella hydrocarbonica]